MVHTGACGQFRLHSCTGQDAGAPRCAVSVPYASGRYELECAFSIPRHKCFRAGFVSGK